MIKSQFISLKVLYVVEKGLRTHEDFILSEHGEITNYGGAIPYFRRLYFEPGHYNWVEDS